MGLVKADVDNATRGNEGVAKVVGKPIIEGAAVEDEKPKVEIVWRNVILMGLLHITIPYSLYLLCFKVKGYTAIWAFCLHWFGGLGITAGAHRLWSHRSYKAKWPLRLLLAFWQTLCLQNDIYEWSRDHRVHHKFSETDADPHNAQRGFFFSHMGWLLCKKHPDVKRKGKTVDCSDLLQDPIVNFQRKNYLLLVFFSWFLLPSLLPFLWNETFWHSIYVCVFLRYCTQLHSTWLVNSAAHMWGNQPYDRFIQPAENLGVTLIVGGEGYHNYHHTFPWDYSTSEHGWKLNFTTGFINFFALFGLAYDLKAVSKQMIEDRKRRTGDGTTSFSLGTYHSRTEQVKPDAKNQ